MKTEFDRICDEVQKFFDDYEAIRPLPYEGSPSDPHCVVGEVLE